MTLARFGLSVGLLQLSIAPVLAQTAAPGPSTTASGGMGWLWIILLLVVVGAAVWYFAFRGKSTRGSSFSTGTTSMGVDRDRVAGSAEQAKGSIKEGVGDVLGDAKLKAQGRIDKAEGRAQNTAGGIKDTLRGQ
jgi:uncharacterized protein YjbJ (UPF0337 family)